jgi:hypothetical protein
MIKPVLASGDGVVVFIASVHIIDVYIDFFAGRDVRKRNERLIEGMVLDEAYSFLPHIKLIPKNLDEPIPRYRLDCHLMSHEVQVSSNQESALFISFFEFDPLADPLNWLIQKRLRRIEWKKEAKEYQW